MQISQSIQRQSRSGVSELTFTAVCIVVLSLSLLAASAFVGDVAAEDVEDKIEVQETHTVEEDVEIQDSTSERVGNTTAWPARASGNLDWNVHEEDAGGMCTAFTVRDNFVVTAAHCVYDLDVEELATNMTYYPGQSETGIYPYGKVEVDAMAVPGGWTQDTKNPFVDGPFEHDYAVVRLEQNIGSQVGTKTLLTLTEDSLTYEQPMAAYHYPGDKTGRPMWKGEDIDPRLSYRNSDYISHSIGGTTDGSSGAGVYVNKPHDVDSPEEMKKYVVGIHTHGGLGSWATRLDPERTEAIEDMIGLIEALTDDPDAPNNLPDLVDDGTEWSTIDYGIYYALSNVDEPEAYEIPESGDLQPDSIETQADSGARPVEYGSVISVEHDIRNIGTGPVPPENHFSIEYYLADTSVDREDPDLDDATSIDSTRVYMDGEDVSGWSLQPFHSETAYGTIEMWGEEIEKEESYSICFEIDSQYEVSELETSNNQACFEDLIHIVDEEETSDEESEDRPRWELDHTRIEPDGEANVIVGFLNDHTDVSEAMIQLPRNGPISDEDWEIVGYVEPTGAEGGWDGTSLQLEEIPAGVEVNAAIRLKASDSAETNVAYEYEAEEAEIRSHPVETPSSAIFVSPERDRKKDELTYYEQVSRSDWATGTPTEAEPTRSPFDELNATVTDGPSEGVIVDLDTGEETRVDLDVNGQVGAVGDLNRGALESHPDIQGSDVEETPGSELPETFAGFELRGDTVEAGGEASVEVRFFNDATRLDGAEIGLQPISDSDVSSEAGVSLVEVIQGTDGGAFDSFEYDEEFEILELQGLQPSSSVSAEFTLDISEDVSPGVYNIRSERTSLDSSERGRTMAVIEVVDDDPVDGGEAPDCSTVSYDGDGTSDDPYEVGDINQLQCIVDQADDEGFGETEWGEFKLVSDIDASGTASWNDDAGFDPIELSFDGFNDTFDGDGYEISGLTIDRPDEENVGLFGSTEEAAVIQDVSVVDAEITGGDGNDALGIVVGLNRGTVSDVSATGEISEASGGDLRTAGGVVGENDGRIDGIDPVVEDSTADVDVVGQDRFGGLVGENDRAKIIDSVAYGDVGSEDSFSKIGGLAGQNAGGTITNSSAYGEVAGSREIAGLLGENRNGGSVVGSSAEGDVVGESNIGGLVGSHDQGFEDEETTITRSSAYGDVEAERDSGGLVGINLGGVISDSYARGDISTPNGSDSASSGGLVGENSGVVERSYATGEVSGVTTLGGLVGQNGRDASSSFDRDGSDGVIRDSYWDSSASGQTEAIGQEGGEDDGDFEGGASIVEGELTGLSTSEMQGDSAASDMGGFDFENVWTTVADPDDYPELRGVDETDGEDGDDEGVLDPGNPFAGVGGEPVDRGSVEDKILDWILDDDDEIDGESFTRSEVEGFVLEWILAR